LLFAMPNQLPEFDRPSLDEVVVGDQFEPLKGIQLSTTTGGFLTQTASVAAWVFEVAKKLDALGKLRPDWDSHGGLSLNQKSRDLTLNMLGWLASEELPTPAVVLGSAGNVCLEWRAKGRELEVDLGDGEKIAFVKVFPDGSIEEGERQTNLPTELRGLTSWFMHGELPPAR